MRILFVASEVIASEPMGILQLSAIRKNEGHDTRLVTLDRNEIEKIFLDYKPHVIAYSCMTADISNFKKADQHLLKLIPQMPHSVLRIMGGPHPTYFKEVLEEMDLDAICVGEGDYAIIKAEIGDEYGNLYFKETARNFSPLMAMAAKTTIVEVEKLVKIGELDPSKIHLPGIFVQRIYQGSNYLNDIEFEITKD